MVSRQRAWPDVFEVTIEDVGGLSRTYTVGTWLQEEEAIAMAVKVHLHRYAAVTPLAQLAYDVKVRWVGPAERSVDGTVSTKGWDAIDRYEF